METSTVERTTGVIEDWKVQDRRLKSNTRYVPLFIIAAVGILPYLGMIVLPSTRVFGPDSWSYYDLSQTIFTDFYHASVTRSFYDHDGYARSFPPLWPVLIAMAERVLRLGARSAVVLAALLALVTVIPLRVIAGTCVSRRVLAPFATAAVWFGLLWFPPYLQEVHSGCSIPLAVLLLSGAVACLIRSNLPGSWRLAGGVGLLLGLACLARFDALLFSAAVLLGCLAAPSIRIHAKAALVLTFLIAVSPWVLYSKKHYGVYWTSDNFGVALSASPVLAQDYRMPTETAATHPTRWAGRLALNATKLGLALFAGVDLQPVLPLSLAAVFILWPLVKRRGVHLAQPLGKLLLLLAIALAGLAGQVLTGYVDRRYFSFFCLLATCWAVCTVLRRTRAIRVTVALGLAALLVLSPQPFLEWTRQEFGGGPQPFRLQSSLRRELLAGYQGATLLADSLCYETGAVTRILTVCLPTDWSRLSLLDKQKFLSSMRITHALVPASDSEFGNFQVLPIRVDLPLRTR